MGGWYDAMDPAEYGMAVVPGRCGSHVGSYAVLP